MKKEQEEHISKENKEVYIDSNLFIFSIISIEKEGEKARAVIEKIKKGDYKAYTSILTIDEVLWIVQKEKDRETAYEGIKILIEIPNLNFLEVTGKIMREAIEIYKTEKLDPRDSIHLACMRDKNISSIISSDPDFDKIKDMKRIDFIK